MVIALKMLETVNILSGASIRASAMEECDESGEGASVNAYQILRNLGCNMDRRPQAGGLYCNPNFEE